ncbi:MAG: hypothetical protein WB697_03280 [Stellaceae bacterium]
MKPYIIAALLFLTGFLVLGVLTANLMAPPKPKPQAHAVPQHKPVGGYAPSGPQEPSYPAAMPSTHSAGTRPTGPGMASTMPGMPSTGISPGSGSMPGTSAPIGVSTTVAPPKPQPIEPTNPVPIIQPTDLGNAPTPTAGKQHQ